MANFVPFIIKTGEPSQLTAGDTLVNPSGLAYVLYDVNGNINANNFNYAFIARTTSVELSANSAAIQNFTGSGATVVTLPAVATLAKGFRFLIRNQSASTVTVIAEDSSSVLVIASGTSAYIICMDTATINWNFDYLGINITSGKRLTVQQIMTLVGTDNKTYTFPTTDATIARTDAPQTFTGAQAFSTWINIRSSTGYPGAPSTGKGYEMFFESAEQGGLGSGVMQCYDRSGVAWLPWRVSAKFVNFDQGGIAVGSLTDPGGTLGVNPNVTINGGKLGVGITSSMAAKIHAIATTEQLRLGYDGLNFFSTTIASTGSATLALTASSGTPTFTFNNRIINTLPIRLKGYTVATLPTGTTGDFAYATDLLTPAFLVAAVGGGAVVGPVFYNGTAWVAV